MLRDRDAEDPVHDRLRLDLPALELLAADPRRELDAVEMLQRALPLCERRRPIAAVGDLDVERAISSQDLESSWR